MKVLLINGSPNEKGCTYTALNEIRGKLQEHRIETEIFHIGKNPISGCIDCGQCGSTGRCAIGDEVNYILDKLDEFDGIVVGSPVYYAGPTGQLCAFLDRLFSCSESRMTGKVAAAIVSCRRGGSTAAFDRLNKYFTISKMVVASSQYWNHVHGNTPDEVLKDIEGLQTMRSLGESIAWLLKSIESGRKADVPAPDYEKKVYTNFIR